MRDAGLANNRIGAQGAIALSRALADATVLAALRLGGNPLGDAGGQAMAVLLRAKPPSLTALDLSNCAIGDEGATAVAGALRTNQVLRSLALGNNPLGDAGATAVGRALEENTGIRTLGLGACSWGAAGLSALSTGLLTNAALRSADFSGNDLSDPKASRDLASSLAKTKTLVELDASHAALTDAGVEALADAVRASASLRAVRIEQNTVGRAAREALAAALEERAAAPLGVVLDRMETAHAEAERELAAASAAVTETAGAAAEAAARLYRQKAAQALEAGRKMGVSVAYVQEGVAAATSTTTTGLRCCCCARHARYHSYTTTTPTPLLLPLTHLPLSY